MPKRREAPVVVILVACLLAVIAPPAAASTLLPPLVDGESQAETLTRTIFRTHRPFDNLTLYPYDHTRAGGTGHKFGTIYKALIRDLNPSLVIEVGVHYGLSTISFAQLLKAENSGGAVLAVDTWLGATDWWGDGRAYLSGVGARKELLLGQRPIPMTDLLFENGHPSIYRHFLSNVVHAGVQDRVVPFPIPSTQAARFLAQRKISADLIHIDGSHEYSEVTADLKLWWPIVRAGGVLMGDDYFASDIRQAFTEFARRENVTLESWVREKVIVRKRA